MLGSMGLMMLAILLLIGGMVMMVIFSYRYRLLNEGNNVLFLLNKFTQAQRNSL